MIWRYIEVSNLHLPVAECCRGTTKLRSLHSWSAQLDLLPFNSLFRVLAALIARDSLASEFSQFQAWDFHRYHQWVSPEVIGHSFGKFQLLKSTLTVESFNPQSVSPPFYVNTFIYSSSEFMSKYLSIPTRFNYNISLYLSAIHKSHQFEKQD